MANKNLLFLVLAAFCTYGGGASAQEELTAPLQTEFDSPTPDFDLPEMPSGSGTRSPRSNEDIPAPIESSEDGSLDPFADPMSLGDLQGGDLQESADQFVSGEEMEFNVCDPALLESSGTWLRRGFWYTEFDVVIFDRIWRRDALSLMNQPVGVTTDRLGRQVVLNNSLTINGGQNGAEAAPRLKLGRFLFRDNKNRDHAIEFIAYGGGQWSQNGRLDANLTNSLGTTSLQTDIRVSRGNIGFDGATSTQFEYGSRLNSFELNYHVSSRMTRDRMELEPSGAWVRRAQPSATWSLIAGVRYFDLTENLNWNAFGIPDNNGDTNLEVGTYDVRADNDMVGTQLGFSWSHERARWSVGAEMKGGIFLNHSEVTSAFEVSGNVTSGNNRIEDDNLTLLTDGSVHAKWHLRPNVSLRLGLELMFLTSLSLAPNQINFAPVSTAENIVQANAAYMGGSIGLETYW